ncbi:MAG TPA: tol-pal system protein YbgF [Rhizomicrobium sp.]|jgi:tol-pal system protein YbgF|nr:tol-pal system protein YbgF [Rhizomicrobium sp.]
MNKIRYRIAGATALTCAALWAAAGTLGATSPTAPVSRYVGPASDGSFRVASLFGESDEEKAARLQHEQNQDDATNRLNDKVRDLEDTVRNLTGANEELGHRIDELNAKIERQQKDFEYRLCALSAQQLGASAGTGDPNAVPCPGAAPTTSFNAPPQQPAPQQFTPQADVPAARDNNRLAPQPGVLGTLPAGADNGPPPRGNAAGDTSAQFSTAMTLLAKARYDEAAAAFRNFADTNPKDDNASQAIYWVGDIAYVQKDYATASRTFAEVIKKYPTSARAPDSMLKLGQSLIAAGQKKEGCTILAALPDKYPKAAKPVLSQGADARKAVCHGIS